MQLDLTEKEFRRLLDLVYIGNWILNATRGNDRFQEYDELESKLFGQCLGTPMGALAQRQQGVPRPSEAYCEGGIHEAIAYYEDEIFYDLLAEELSRRDMGYPEITPQNVQEIQSRMDGYLEEFYANGLERFSLEENL